MWLYDYYWLFFMKWIGTLLQVQTSNINITISRLQVDVIDEQLLILLALELHEHRLLPSLAHQLDHLLVHYHHFLQHLRAALAVLNIRDAQFSGLGVVGELDLAVVCEFASALLGGQDGCEVYLDVLLGSKFQGVVWL